MNSITMRQALPDDAEYIARLSEQLGYPVTRDAVWQNLTSRDNQSVIAMAAVDEDGMVIGWVDVMLRPTLVIGTFAEINGLVVSEEYRGKGIRQQLMAAAEAWALAEGCQEIRVRSNTIRHRAHQFYEDVLGYDRLKTQAVFVKHVESIDIWTLFKQRGPERVNMRQW